MQSDRVLNMGLPLIIRNDYDYSAQHVSAWINIHNYSQLMYKYYPFSFGVYIMSNKIIDFYTTY